MPNPKTPKAPKPAKTAKPAKLPLWSPVGPSQLSNNPVLPRCALCPHVANRSPIPGSGPRPAKILFLGEAPSYKEDRQGIPFVGPTGLEFTYTYLPLAGLNRDDVRITNVVRCSDEKYRNPKPILAQCCSDHHLERELIHTKPQIIVPLGSIACSLWSHLSLSRDWGYAQHLTYKSWSGIVFPLYHPAMGIHSGPSMRLLRYGFLRLGDFLRAYDRDQDLTPYFLSQIPYPTAKHHSPDLDYTLCQTPNQLSSYLSHVQDYQPELTDTPSFDLALDTEFIDRKSARLTQDQPYSLSLSLAPRSSVVFRVDTPSAQPLLQTLAEFLTTIRPRLLIHYATADLPILHQLSLPYQSLPLLDTAMIAYHLGHPQSLKLISHRLLNTRQQSFYDLTQPYYHALCLPLAERIATHQFPHPPKDRSWRIERYAQSWIKRATQATHLENSTFDLELESNLDEDPDGESGPDADNDEDNAVWTWDKAFRGLRAKHPAKARAMEEYLGRDWPAPTIDLVPDQDLLWYAGADADLTLRAGWIMEALRKSGDYGVFSYEWELADMYDLRPDLVPGGRTEWVLRGPDLGTNNACEWDETDQNRDETDSLGLKTGSKGAK